MNFEIKTKYHSYLILSQPSEKAAVKFFRKSFGPHAGKDEAVVVSIKLVSGPVVYFLH